MRTTTRPKKAASQGGPNPTIYGLVAEFDDPDTLLHAAEQASDAGYTRLDAYTPFPVHGMSEAVGKDSTRLPWFVFAGGMTGLTSAILLVTYATLLDYPMLLHGRPPFNWQTSVPIFFEMSILFAAFATIFGLLASCNLPAYYHPMFNAPNFERATQDGFFLCIEATDPKFDRSSTQQFLQGLHAKAVSEVMN
jgi:hypothetical protein